MFVSSLNKALYLKVTIGDSLISHCRYVLSNTLSPYPPTFIMAPCCIIFPFRYSQPSYSNRLGKDQAQQPLRFEGFQG
jgi:hypothetical protein